MTKFGGELLKSAREALEIARGEATAQRVLSFDAPDPAAIRKRLKLSQGEFAERFGLPAATVRDWEQGRRRPDAPARALLKVIDYAPETVARAVGDYRAE
jgi:putative transcriptional regulator